VAKSKSSGSSKFSRSSKRKTPKPKKNVPCTPTGGVHRFFKLELLGQRRVNQFKEFSHRRYIHDTDKTLKQLPHFVADVTAAQSATTVIVTTANKDLPH
jgi:hypothetical protein